MRSEGPRIFSRGGRSSIRRALAVFCMSTGIVLNWCRIRRTGVVVRIGRTADGATAKRAAHFRINRGSTAGISRVAIAAVSAGSERLLVRHLMPMRAVSSPAGGQAVCVCSTTYSFASIGSQALGLRSKSDITSGRRRPQAMYRYGGGRFTPTASLIYAAWSATTIIIKNR